MSLFGIGRICVKLSGREAGRKCVVVDVIDKNFVLVTGPKPVSNVKRRRANVKQLEPLEMIEIKKNISDEELEKELKKLKKIDYMKEKIKIKV
ncbi:MAG: 50S ribosomal protein L14e [Candidatus Helarchaeota archaeon]